MTLELDYGLSKRTISEEGTLTTTIGDRSWGLTLLPGDLGKGGTVLFPRELSDYLVSERRLEFTNGHNLGVGDELKLDGLTIRGS